MDGSGGENCKSDGRHNLVTVLFIVVWKEGIHIPLSHTRPGIVFPMYKAEEAELTYY